MDANDDDMPPELVEVGDQVTDEEKPVRVPITIVTGMGSDSEVDADARPTDCIRLSWSWEDHLAELHFNGRARQEDCRHHERYFRFFVHLRGRICADGSQSLATVCTPLMPQARSRLADAVAALDIEKSLTVNKDGDSVEEWLDVGNGCICCSVK